MPFVSRAQQRWAHTAQGTKALGGPDKVAEWDHATAGRSLPMHVGHVQKAARAIHAAATKKGGKRHWMKGAVKRPGALTRKANAAGMSPMAFARAHYHSKGLTGEQARYAVNAQK